MVEVEGGTRPHCWDSPPLGSANATSLSSLQALGWVHLLWGWSLGAPLLSPTLLPAAAGDCPLASSSSAPRGTVLPAATFPAPSGNSALWEEELGGFPLLTHGTDTAFLFSHLLIYRYIFEFI